MVSGLMIKIILVGVDGSEHARTARQYGFWLGEQLDATVVGLHVVDIVSIEGSFFHDISGSLGFEPYLDFSSKMREALRERGRLILETFGRRCAERNVRCDSALEMGIVANEICDQARTADLVVIGHRGVNEQFSTGLLGSTAESVARKCPRPLFVSPKHFDEIQRPVLAYDGSDRASRAMHFAAEIAESLHVPLAVITVARDLELGERTLAVARRYLEPHAIDAEFKLIRNHAHEGIIGFLKEHNADLLFIGAYGHSRIIEMVLGSNTEYVLRNAPCPIFLSR